MVLSKCGRQQHSANSARAHRSIPSHQIMPFIHSSCQLLHLLNLVLSKVHLPNMCSPIVNLVFQNIPAHDMLAPKTCLPKMGSHLPNMCSPIINLVYTQQLRQQLTQSFTHQHTHKLMQQLTGDAKRLCQLLRLHQLLCQLLRQLLRQLSAVVLALVSTVLSAVASAVPSVVARFGKYIT